MFCDTSQLAVLSSSLCAWTPNTTSQSSQKLAGTRASMAVLWDALPQLLASVESYFLRALCLCLDMLCHLWGMLLGIKWQRPEVLLNICQGTFAQDWCSQSSSHGVKVVKGVKVSRAVWPLICLPLGELACAVGDDCGGTHLYPQKHKN